MKLTALYVVFAIMLLGSGCTRSSTDTSSEPTVDRGSILSEARENGLIMDEEEIAAMSLATLETDPAGQAPQDVSIYSEQDMKGWWSAALADVTGGTSYGIARATLDSGTFSFLAEVGNLPELAEGYFYEVWLVRRGESLGVLSLGPLQKIEKGFGFVYQTSTDLSDHDFVVVTLEDNDGNKAPGEHILEGSLK